MAQVKLVFAAIAAFALFLAAPAGAAGLKPAQGDMVIGRADAPVTVIEYASMTCPHCATFHNKTFKALKEKYIDTGQVRMVFREFPLDGVALRASMLARCAGEDRFFGMIDVLFRQQAKWTRSNDPVGALVRLARMGGLSQGDIEACLADEALMDSILTTRLEGHNQYKVESTPSFVIEGKTYAGGMTMDDWDAILAKYLN